eukprot:2439274-Rhodomonas_salina.2
MVDLFAKLSVATPGTRVTDQSITAGPGYPGRGYPGPSPKGTPEFTSSQDLIVTTGTALALKRNWRRKPVDRSSEVGFGAALGVYSRSAAWCSSWVIFSARSRQWAEELAPSLEAVELVGFVVEDWGAQVDQLHHERQVAVGALSRSDGPTGPYSVERGERAHPCAGLRCRVLVAAASIADVSCVRVARHADCIAHAKDEVEDWDGALWLAHKGGRMTRRGGWALRRRRVVGWYLRHWLCRAGRQRTVPGDRTRPHAGRGRCCDVQGKWGCCTVMAMGCCTVMEMAVDMDLYCTRQAGTTAECAGGGRVVGASGEQAPPRRALHETQRRVEGSFDVMTVRQRLWGMRKTLLSVGVGSVCVGWGAPDPSLSHPVNANLRCPPRVQQGGGCPSDGSHRLRKASVLDTVSGMSRIVVGRVRYGRGRGRKWRGHRGMLWGGRERDIDYGGERKGFFGGHGQVVAVESRNGIGDEVVTKIAEALPSLGQLRRRDVPGNTSGGEEEGLSAGFGCGDGRGGGGGR